MVILLTILAAWLTPDAPRATCSPSFDSPAIFSRPRGPVEAELRGCATSAAMTCAPPVFATLPGTRMLDGDAASIVAPPGTPPGAYPCALTSSEGVAPLVVLVAP